MIAPDIAKADGDLTLQGKFPHGTHSFSIVRTTRQDGYSEDLSAPPPVVAPAERVPMIGTWQIQLTNPAQGSTFDNVFLFFLYEFTAP